MTFSMYLYTIRRLAWSMFEKSFPQSARPALQYILPEFGLRSPLRRPIWTKFPTNCDAYLAENLFQTRSKKEGDRTKRVTGHGANRKRKGLITEERGLFLEKEVKVQENKMGVMPVAKLLLTMSVPMMISMLVQALYNIVDSMFVAKLSESALTAVSLAFPVQMMMVAVGIGTGVGANALIARALGQGDREKVGAAAGNALTLMGIIYAVCLLFGAFGAGAYIGSQTSDPIALAMGSQYLRICCMASFGILFFSVFEKTLQATGRSLYSTIAQVAGALTNIVLDPIMIYGLLGCPKLDVAGAAWATVLGQITSLALAAVFHFRLNRELPFRRKALRLRRSIVGEIYSIGVPAIIAQGAMSVMNYCVNLIFGSLDSSYVTAYGIVYKIQQFVLFAAFGLRDAITPIVSFSYGMQNAKRIREGVRCGLMYTSVLMLVCTAAVEILAQPLAGIFSLSAGTMGLCVTGLRVLAVSFVFAGANIAIQGVFQATEGGVQSLLVSLLRQLIFVLPAAWLFARLLPAGVWLAFPIAEVLTAVIAAVLLRHTAGKGRLSQQDHAASLSKSNPA